MAINYVIKKRTIRFGADPGVKYCAVIFRGQDVDFDTLAEEINNSTTVNKSDAMACLMAMESIIAKHVLNGSAVKLGKLGAFIPKIQSKAESESKNVTADSIRKAACRFYPSAAFMKQLRYANFEYKDVDTDIVHPA